MSLLDDCATFTSPFEGLSLTPYLDPAGIPTIGYGSTRGVTMGMGGITLQEAQERLENDLCVALRSVERLIKVPLKPNQIIALVDFCFNLGSGRLQASTLRRKINRGEGGVEQQFNRWVYSGGRKLKGLVRRRQAEAALWANASF